MPKTYRYLIVGGGLTAASAVEGIREIDTEGPIGMIAREPHLPYFRPPLSKKVWTEDWTLGDLTVHGAQFYTDNGTEVHLGREASGLDPDRHVVTDDTGAECRYEKLLLATGSTPRRLGIPGDGLEGVFYYRHLDDYLALRPRVAEGKSAVVIGGSFVGSEMAAALNVNGMEVTMVYPSPHLCSRVFPASLGQALQEKYRERGIRILAGDAPAAIERVGERLLVGTSRGERLECDVVVIGVGVAPSVELAREARLAVENGIVVNDCLRTGHPDVYAAGDNALFHYSAIGQWTRIEHYNHAINQGLYAGRNLAGAGQPYDHMPFFFSDLFDFSYEAVGNVDARLEVFVDWQKENDTGVVYYLEGARVKGAMMCNVMDKVADARELILRDQDVTPDDLRGAIV